MREIPRCGLDIQLLLEYLEQDSSPTISDGTTDHHDNVDRPKFEDGTIPSALDNSCEKGDTPYLPRATLYVLSLDRSASYSRGWGAGDVWS
jgi:hypothetical protein